MALFHTIEYSLATKNKFLIIATPWMKAKNITLNERKQTQSLYTVLFHFYKMSRIGRCT
jgi:hypothetical protein